MSKVAKRLICAVLALIIISSSSFVYAKSTIPGDMTGDGKINSKDALNILEFAVSEEKYGSEIIEIGDLDLNGKLDSCDALLVLKKSVGLEIDMTSIKLSQGDVTVKIGTEMNVTITQFTPVIADNTEVLWSSSDSSKATVDENGKIKAIASGKTTITAKAKKGDATASFILTVGKKASSVTLSKASISVSQGSTYKLTPTVAPADTFDKKVTWSTSDKTIVTVTSDGKVKGLKIGTATITCKTADGSNKTASCKVTVNAMSIPYVSQLPKYPTGCEAASCCMLLKYYKFSITLDEMIGFIPRKNLYTKNGKTYGPDINEMFVGDPKGYYTSANPGYGAFSPVVTKSLQTAIDKKGGGYKAVKISGCTFNELLKHISNGQPAIVWATYKMMTPTKKNEWYIESTGKYFSYPRGTHVMILSGYSDTEVVTVDPYDNGVLKFSRSTFENRWKLLGNQAIVLEKV